MPEYAVLNKDTIKNPIMPYLSTAKRGFISQFDLLEVVNAILYKLKSGCQWRMLPMGHLVTGEPPSYITVFKHYRKWCKNGDWESTLRHNVNTNRDQVVLSLSHIDGSHTPAYRGGEKVEYQGRKKRTTTNALYFVDRQGMPLAISEPLCGNHADLFEIKDRIDEIAAQLSASGIATDVLFCNPDAGFDGSTLRSVLNSHEIISNMCPNQRNVGEPSEDILFNEEMYKDRWKIERTNAWMDSFKAALMRFDTTVSSWKGWNYLAFIAISLKRFHKSA